MGFKNIYISLDNASSGGYTPGSTIAGRVIISANQDIHIRSLMIKVLGEASVSFQDTVTRIRRCSRNEETFTEYETFTANERYISTSYNILGETLIHTGEQEFIFNVVLPSILPSTFNGHYGYIKYWIKVKMDKAWNFDQVAKAEFIVAAPKDLNYITFIPVKGRGPVSLADPQLVRDLKHFNFLCCRTGPLSLCVELPKSGWVCGETLQLTIELDNNTDVNISSVNIILKQEIIWTARSPSSNSTTSSGTLLTVTCQGVSQKDSRAWNQRAIIPDIPYINIDECSIIKLQHFILVEAVAEGMHRNLTVRAPIVIGTIPVGRMPQPQRTYDPPYLPPQTTDRDFRPPDIGFRQTGPSAPTDYGFNHSEPPPPYPITPKPYPEPVPNKKSL